MKKLTQKFLRIWISLISIFAFLLGWIALAHAQKPAPLVVESTVETVSLEIPELEPVPSISELSQNAARPSFSQPSVNFNMPRLRTRGS